MKKYLILLSTYCLLGLSVQPLTVSAAITEEMNQDQAIFDSANSPVPEQVESDYSESIKSELAHQKEPITQTNAETIEETENVQQPLTASEKNIQVTADIVAEYLIPDIQLRKIVNKRLGKGAAEIESYSATEAELASITDISLSSLLGEEDLVQFTSLQGIEYLTGLKYGLIIQGAILPGDALTYLSKMTSLEKLAIRNSYFSGNEATVRDMNKSINGENFESVKMVPIKQNIDLSLLGALTNLNTFEFDVNSVDMYPNSLGSSRLYLQLSGLKTLTKLTNLNISSVGDFDDPTFSWISALTNLKKVVIVDAKLTSVKAIAQLPNLTQLTIGGTYVNDLTPVIDKDYFTGATELHYDFETQFYHEENGINVLQLPTVYNFGGTDISTVGFTTLQSYVGTFNIHDSFFETSGLNISLAIKDMKPINKYNYKTGQYDLPTAGVVFGFTATAPNGKKISYSASNTVPIGKIVTFDSNYENGPIETAKLEPLETKVAPIEMTREGYVFEGWYTDKEQTQAFDFTMDINGNKTLYAKWTKINIGSINVRYVDQSGKELAESDTISGPIGSPYETTAKEIPGWEVTTIPDNMKGVFTEDAKEVVYIYSKIEDEDEKIETPIDESRPPLNENTHSTENKKTDKKLPSTGENLTMNGFITVSGIVLLIGTGVYFYLEKKKAKK